MGKMCPQAVRKAGQSQSFLRNAGLLSSDVLGVGVQLCREKI